MKKILLLSFILVLSNLLFAQATDQCGTPRNVAVKRILKSKAIIQQQLPSLPEDEKYIPIKFHLVADSDGQNRVTEQEVLQALCEVNQEFDEVGFTFYIKDSFNYVDNSYVNDYTPTSSTVHSFCEAEYDSTAINVFIVQKINNTGIETPLTIYDPAHDWIVVEDRVGLNKLYVSHGLGHFFSLLHTYSRDLSWSSEDNAPMTMEIDTSSACAQNCETVGDLICDTPPDYEELEYSLSCTYNGAAKDYCGTPISPMLNNIMTKWDCESFMFTPGQALVMQADYLKPSRVYIQSSYIPNTAGISQAVLVSPLDNATLPGATEVTLDWEDTPGASSYLLEIAGNSLFQNAQTYVASQSELTIMVAADELYFWRISPYNETNTCSDALVSDVWSFSTIILGASDLSNLTNWLISPNPSTSDIHLSIQTPKTMKLTIQLLDINGRVIHQESKQILNNTHSINLTNKHLPSGQYWIRMISPDASDVRSVIIE